MAGNACIRPRNTVKSETLKNALRNFIVKPISEKYHVISTRCLWDVVQEDRRLAELKIYSKKDAVHHILDKFEEVVFYASCLTAMTSSNYRQLHK